MHCENQSGGHSRSKFDFPSGSLFSPNRSARALADSVVSWFDFGKKMYLVFSMFSGVFWESSNVFGISFQIFIGFPADSIFWFFNWTPLIKVPLWTWYVVGRNDCSNIVKTLNQWETDDLKKTGKKQLDFLWFAGAIKQCWLFILHLMTKNERNHMFRFVFDYFQLVGFFSIS